MKHIDDNTYMIEATDRIREFDCHVLSIDFSGGGGFCTVFPISPKSYRNSARRRLPDKVEIEYFADTTDFLITDDWGNVYRVSIANNHESAIEQARTAAIKDGLLA